MKKYILLGFFILGLAIGVQANYMPIDNCKNSTHKEAYFECKTDNTKVLLRPIHVQFHITFPDGCHIIADFYKDDVTGDISNGYLTWWCPGGGNGTWSFARIEPDGSHYGDLGIKFSEADCDIEIEYWVGDPTTVTDDAVVNYLNGSAQITAFESEFEKDCQ